MQVLSPQLAEIRRLFQSVRERLDRGKGGNKHDLHFIYLSDFGQKPVQIWLCLFVREVHLQVGSYNLFFHDRLALHGHRRSQRVGSHQAGGSVSLGIKIVRAPPVKHQLKPVPRRKVAGAAASRHSLIAFYLHTERCRQVLLRFAEVDCTWRYDRYAKASQS